MARLSVCWQSNWEQHDNLETAEKDWCCVHLILSTPNSSFPEWRSFLELYLVPLLNEKMRSLMYITELRLFSLNSLFCSIFEKSTNPCWGLKGYQIDVHWTMAYQSDSRAQEMAKIHLISILKGFWAWCCLCIIVRKRGWYRDGSVCF